MPTGATVTLYADGVRVADGAPTDDPLAPTALAGLSVVWGRASSIDQPDPSTCSADLVDSPGGPSFAQTFRTGTDLRVTATATRYPDPSVSTFPDAGFESGAPIHGSDQRVEVTRSTTRAYGGTHSARMRPTSSATSQWSTVLAPAPFTVPGGPPGAWDAIPVTVTGQRWTYGASVWVPAGVTVKLSPALYPSPAAASVIIAADAVTVVGDGAWHTVSGTFVPELPGVWAGLQVSAYPKTGRTWATVTGSWNAQTQTWDDMATVYVDDVQILSPAAGPVQTVLVFAGRVTNVQAVYDETAASPMLRVTASDFTADLDNRDVGDLPWVAETMGARVSRILALTGLPVAAVVDPSVASTVVSWRDVDRQPATGLLRELASTVDAVLWSATHQSTGPYLRFEDPAVRPSAQRLVKSGPLVIIVPLTDDLTELSACEVPREAVSWAQDVQDVSTRVDVTWLEQLVEDGAPTTLEHTESVVDAVAEASRGVRRIALTSQLTTAADARAVAARLAGRTSAAWRMDGLTLDDWDVDPTDANTVRLLMLLDGTTRNGVALSLTDLPEWAPGQPAVALYVEGGAYTFNDGRWLLELVVSNTLNQGHSVTFDDLGPTGWKWNEFDPAISWDDLRGTSVTTAKAGTI